MWYFTFKEKQLTRVQIIQQARVVRVLKFTLAGLVRMVKISGPCADKVRKSLGSVHVEDQAGDGEDVLWMVGTSIRLCLIVDVGDWCDFNPCTV